MSKAIDEYFERQIEKEKNKINFGDISFIVAGTCIGVIGLVRLHNEDYIAGGLFFISMVLVFLMGTVNIRLGSLINAIKCQQKK